MSATPPQQSRAPITSTGKPMRALLALAESDADAYPPLTEHRMWLVCRGTHGEKAVWHAPLAALVARGLATRTGRRGGYEWYITAAGRDLLAEKL